jgi:F-type H+-transporting ATPase subunit delta
MKIMKAELFAREYARVLDRLAQDERAAIQSHFRRLGDSMEQAGDVKTFFNHPAIPDSEKLRSLESTAPQRFSPVVGRVLGDIIKRRMTFLFTAIADEMERLSDEALHIHSVLVTSAAALPENLRKKLTERMKAYCAGEVKMQFAVDGALMAGFCIKIGDTVIDNSMRTELEHIRRKLMTVSST